VRIELANPGLLLKPAMFARVDIPVGGKGQVVTVPTSGVIDSGTRRIVLVALGEGRFAPREVKLGGRSDNHVRSDGWRKAGENVVVAANFLIDAESNLKAAVGSFGPCSPARRPAAWLKAPDTGPEATVESVDTQAGTVMLEHGPVASLKWPAMSMEFKLANPALQSRPCAGRKGGRWSSSSASRANG
jgi:Cu(I)/Ag(I) efflux system membrane fusion protein